MNTEGKKKPIGTFVFIVVIMLALILIIGWAIPPIAIQHSSTPEGVSNLDLYRLTVDRSSHLEIVIWQSMTVHLVGMLGILLAIAGLVRKMHLVN